MNKSTDTEDLKKRIESLEMRMDKIEISSKTNPLVIDDYEFKIRGKIDDIGIQHLILLALKLQPKQSKQGLKTQLESWGKPVGTWFRGGNFKNRLLKPSQIIPDGIDENKEELYSLGSKGVKTVKNLIEKYELKNV